MLRRHVGEQVADGLVLPDRLRSSRGPGRSAGHRRRRPGHPDRAAGHLDAARLEPVHHLREALALGPAEQCVGRHAAVVEVQLARLDTFVAQLGQVAEDREAGDLLDQQDRDAPVGGVATGSVLHSSATRPDRRAFVIQVFVPLMT